MTRWDFERAVLASGLPTLTRMILLVLATHTNGGNTAIPAKHSPSLTALARATGLDRRSVMRHLLSAERIGWLARHRPPIALARSTGACTRYVLSVPGRGTETLPRGTESLPVGAQSHLGRGTVPHKDSPVRPSQSSTRARTRAESLIAELGADDEEIKIVIEKIKTEHNPRSLGAYVATLAENGDLADLLDRARAEVKEREQYDALRIGWHCHRCYSRNRVNATKCRQCGVAA